MAQHPLRVIFAGTPDFAATHLKHLIDSKHQIIAVYTQPDRPAGRGRKLQASPVKLLAEQAGLNTYQPPSLKDAAAQKQLAALDADVMIVVAYGLILPQAVLDAARIACLNVHASLLPRWRGAAPIQRAIEAGDTTTGITIMRMDAGLDTGEMLAAASIPIGPHTTAGELHDELAVLGPPLLLDVLENLERHLRAGRDQDDQQATYAHKILKPEAQINWNLSALALDRKIRAFNPFPVCFSHLDGKRVRVWQARPLTAAPSEAPGTIVSSQPEGIVICCGDGTLCVEVLQLEGSKALTVKQLLNAHPKQFAVGKHFETPPAAEH